jgi:hypothetical protein
MNFDRTLHRVTIVRHFDQGAACNGHGRASPLEVGSHSEAVVCDRRHHEESGLPESNPRQASLCLPCRRLLGPSASLSASSSLALPPVLCRVPRSGDCMTARSSRGVAWLLRGCAAAAAAGRAGCVGLDDGPGAIAPGWRGHGGRLLMVISTGCRCPVRPPPRAGWPGAAPPLGSGTGFAGQRRS